MVARLFSALLHRASEAAFGLGQALSFSARFCMRLAGRLEGWSFEMVQPLPRRPAKGEN